MTILHATKVTGAVEAILINPNADDDSIETARVDKVGVTFAGFEGERHSGLVSKSDVRYRKQYAIDTPFRNTRQVSMVSLEDLAQIAGNLGVEREGAIAVGDEIALHIPPQRIYTVVP